MPKTRAELRDKIYSIVVGSTPSEIDAVDSNKIDAVIDGTVIRLRRIYHVADPGQIGPTGGAFDDAAFDLIAICCAEVVAPDFSDLRDYSQKAAMARSELELLAAPPRTLTTLRIDPGLLPYRRGAVLS